MEEGSIPGLRKCMYGGMFVFEDEDLAYVCVSSSRYGRVFLCVSRVIVCVSTHTCVYMAGPGLGTANQYSWAPVVPHHPLPRSQSHCSLGGAGVGGVVVVVGKQHM